MEETAEWLKSPVSENALRLKPYRDVWLKPFRGKERRFVVRRTEISIGNCESCDVWIDDPYVSPRHAELKLENEGGGYFIQDLSSRNGVFLNGVRVKIAPLPSSGTLRLGRSVLSWSEKTLDLAELAEGLVVADPCMRSLFEDLQKVAATSLPILLLGETGTGKDQIARMIHHWSRHPNGPFVPVNGALTGGSLADSELFGHRRGAFTGAESARLGALRTANGGTLFLDEIADVPAETQVKLLRSFEGGEVKAMGSDQAEKVDFRLVTATSRNLERRVKDGQFRNDLYYRIAGHVIHVPPLRERPKDVVAIATKLALDRGLELDEESAARLLSYAWPGNVRELRSCIERAAASARISKLTRIFPEHLGRFEGAFSQGFSSDTLAPRTLDEIEKEVLRESLDRHGWSRTQAARELGIARSTLWAKMKRYGLALPIGKQDFE